MSTVYTCKAPGCKAGTVSKSDCGPEFFCRTAGMNAHFFHSRTDGTCALSPTDCSPGCGGDDYESFHDAACARRLAERERARPEPANNWDDWWRDFLEHVAAHGVGYRSAP